MTLAINSARSAELQIISWFLDTDWEVYTPFADHGTELIVRAPNGNKPFFIQVKHKQNDAKNEGILENAWRDGNARFDYLVFFQPSKIRGFILGKRDLARRGNRLSLFRKDGRGYPTGEPRPLFRSLAFDLSHLPAAERGRAFTDFLLETHARSLARLPFGPDTLLPPDEKKRKPPRKKRSSKAKSVLPEPEAEGFMKRKRPPGRHKAESQVVAGEGGVSETP